MLIGSSVGVDGVVRTHRSDLLEEGGRGLATIATRTTIHPTPTYVFNPPPLDSGLMVFCSCGARLQSAAIREAPCPGGVNMSAGWRKYQAIYLLWLHT